MGRQRRRGLSLRGIIILIILGIGVGIGAVVFLGSSSPDATDETANQSAVQDIQPTASPVVTVAAVEGSQTNRKIFFPNAETAGTVVEAYREGGSWDVSQLQDLVGHLEGTPWLGQPGNIVLAGHFEDALGRPGPFRYLYFAQVGDKILLQDGDQQILYVYEVRDVFRTDPNDVEVLRKTDTPRLTLITCDSWSYEQKEYQERLVVVAEPIGTTDESATVSQVQQ